MKNLEAKKKLKELVYQIDLNSLQIPTVSKNISTVKQIEKLYKLNFNIVENLLLKNYHLENLYSRIERLGQLAKKIYLLSLSDINLLIDSFKNSLIVSIQNNILDIDEISAIEKIEKARYYIAKGYFYAELNEEIEQLKFLVLHYKEIFNIHYKFLIDIKDFFLKKIDNISFVDVVSCEFSKWINKLEAQLMLFSAKEQRFILQSQLLIAHKNIHLEANSIIDFIKSDDFIRATESLKNFFNNFLLLEKILSDIIAMYEKDRLNNFIEFMLKKSYWERNFLYYFIVHMEIPRLIVYKKNGLLEKIIKQIGKKLNENDIDFFSFIFNKELHILLRKPNFLSNEDIDSKLKNYIDELTEKLFFLSSIEKIKMYAIRLDDLKKRDIKYFREMLTILKRKREYEKFIVVDNGFLNELSVEVKENLKKAAIISKKIKNSEIELFIQKIVDKDNRIFCLEVLSKIRIGKRYLSAYEFIKILEEQDLTLEFDMIVIKKIREYFSLLSKFSKKISINIFPSSIRNKSFIDEIIKSYNLAKNYSMELIIEITEHTIVEDLEILKKLYEDKEIKFAIDDLGTGYSNIKTIIELASKNILSFVKIDGSLIEDIDRNKKNREVVRQLIKFIEIMELKPIVAEFVDSKEKSVILRDISENIVYQGFYFSKPKKIESFIDEV